MAWRSMLSVTGCPRPAKPNRPRTWASVGWLRARRPNSSWIDTLASFEYGQKDLATADAMTVRLLFTGAGKDTATEEDQQTMLDFVAWITT